MPVRQRLLMILGACLVFYVIIYRIRTKKILMNDAIYWVILSVVLVLMGIFPEVIIRISGKLGFMSPSNLVFLAIVALLVVKSFNLSSQISLLSNKVDELTQEVALHINEVEDKLEMTDEGQQSSPSDE